MKILYAGRHRIDYSQRTLIMGILNVTPDSFSDGGNYFSENQAREQAERLIAAGADIIDIGGESSRPGSQPVSVSEEIRRVVPLVEMLSRDYPDIPVSVDTWKHKVAEAALAAGASIINDIYGLHADQELASVISKYGAAVVVMHNAAMYRGSDPATRHFTNSWHMNPEQSESYQKLDLWAAVMKQLEASVDTALSAGITRNQIMIDPGIGFGLTSDESWELIRNVARLKAMDLPVLIAHSRKRFIGDLLDIPVSERDQASAVITAASVAGSADMIRVHDVAGSRQASVIADKLWRNAISKDSDICAKPAFSDSGGIQDAKDKILMRGMVFRGYTGCLQEEQMLGQRFIVDVVIELMNNKASYSDCLEDSVSYADVFELIRGIMSDRRFNLIEKLAGFIADSIIKNYSQISSVEVSVSKPQAPIDGAFDTMQVCVRRYA